MPQPDIQATITQPFTITISVTPAISAINLSNTTVNAGTNNANTLVGHVTVTTNPPGGSVNATITLSGTDANKFVLTQGGKAPCDLNVGPANVAAGSYVINLSTTG